MPKSTIYKSTRFTLIVGVLGFLCLSAMRLACTQRTVFTAATSPSGRFQVIATTSSAGAWDGGVSDYSLRVTTEGSSASYPFLSGVSAGQTSIAFRNEDTIVVTLQGHVTLQKFTNRIQLSPSGEYVFVFLQIE